MFPTSIYDWAWIFALCVTVLLTWVRQRSSKKLPFPPGPPGLPLVKNILDVPSKLEHLVYQKWGQKYGDVIHLSVLGNHFIILNSVKAALELLEQRSKIYSDRPYIPVLHDKELMDVNWIFGLKRYSREWKLHRRIFTQHINPTTVLGQFASRQLATAYQLLNNFLSNPEQQNLLDPFSHASASIVLGVTYGYDVKSENDPLVELASKVVPRTLEGAKPSFLVNVFPAFKHLHWLPGVTFKQFAVEARIENAQLGQSAFDGAKQRIDSGNYTPSFIQSALAEHPEGHDPELLTIIKEVALQMYGAGVDTTAITLFNVTLQLILHPHVQTRAQVELDKVLGSPDSPSFRLPTFDDRFSLPYINALVKEALRWGPPAVLGVPHATLEEDEYRGWRIPKGSTIITNVYSMNREEETYPQPYKFDPERFVEKDGKSIQADPAGTFGFGRRICPGRHLAESMLWIEIACMLAAFTIEPPKDEKTGQPMDLRWAERHEPGGVLRGQFYPCVFKPRSEHVRKVVRETALHAGI